MKSKFWCPGALLYLSIMFSLPIFIISIRNTRGHWEMPSKSQAVKDRERESKELASKNKKGRFIATIQPEWLKVIQHPAPLAHVTEDWAEDHSCQQTQLQYTEEAPASPGKDSEKHPPFPRSRSLSIIKPIPLGYTWAALVFKWAASLVIYNVLILPAPVTDLCRPSLILPPPYLKNVGDSSNSS